MTDIPSHLTPGTIESDIVRFLYDDPDSSFSAIEIVNNTGHDREIVDETAASLVEAGIIQKTRDDHYAARDREELRRYVASLDQLDRMFRK